MTKSIQVEDDVHADLQLLKRANNLSSMTEVIRDLMMRARYSRERLEYMDRFLKEWAE